MRKPVMVGLIVIQVAVGAGAWAQSGSLDEIRQRIDQLKQQTSKFSGGADRKELGSLNFAYNEAMRLVAGAPPNDNCVNAIPVACGDVVQFDTTGANVDAPWSCGTEGADIWYTITGNGGNITFATCGSSFDSMLNTFSGGCGGLVEEICNDDTCGTDAQVILPTVDGTDYLIAVGSFDNETGVGMMTVTCDVAVELTSFEVE